MKGNIMFRVKVNNDKTEFVPIIIVTMEDKGHKRTMEFEADAYVEDNDAALKLCEALYEIMTGPKEDVLRFPDGKDVTDFSAALSANADKTIN